MKVDEFIKELKSLEDLDKEEVTPITDVFTDDLMKEYTKFENIVEFFKVSKYEDKAEKVFESDFNDEEFESFVRENTKFDKFTDMIETFFAKMIQGRLFK